MASLMNPMRSDPMVRAVVVVGMAKAVSMAVPGMTFAVPLELSLRRFPEGVLDRLGPPYPGDARPVAFLVKLLRQFLAQLDIDPHRVRLLALG
jgi:hypothetical protein